MTFIAFFLAPIEPATTYAVVLRTSPICATSPPLCSMSSIAWFLLTSHTLSIQGLQSQYDKRKSTTPLREPKLAVGRPLTFPWSRDGQ